MNMDEELKILVIEDDKYITNFIAMSLEKGEAVTSLPAVKTIAGGIEGGIGSKTFEILRDTIDDVVLVTEAELKKSILWMLRNHQILIEASAAAPVAACLYHPEMQITSPAVLILTGRNISFQTLAAIIAEDHSASWLRGLE